MSTCVPCTAGSFRGLGADHLVHRYPLHIPRTLTESKSKPLIAFCQEKSPLSARTNRLRNAPWGELLSTAAKARGARGAVVDGLIRDILKIEELGFPVFASGIKPVDSMGRGVVTAYNVPVECGEVLVNPGDFVFADYDGVVIIPKDVVKPVLDLATEKVRRENSSRAELMQGAYLARRVPKIRSSLSLRENPLYRNHSGSRRRFARSFRFAAASGFIRSRLLSSCRFTPMRGLSGLAKYPARLSGAEKTQSPRRT